MVAILYFLQHILSFFLLDKRIRNYYVFLSFSLFSVIYFIKRDHYDIPHYIELAKNPQVFDDVGFGYVLNFFYLFTDNPEFVVRCTQCLIALIFLIYGYLAHINFDFTNRTIKKESVLYIFLLIIMSVAFTLGVNNGLRQAFSGILVLYMLLFIIERKYLLAVFIAVPSIFLHGSGLYFLLLCLLLFIFLKLFYFYSILKIRLSFLVTLFCVCMAGVISGLLLSEYISYSEVYSQYSNKILLITGNERLSLSLKLFPIFFIFLFSEIFGGKYSVHNIHLSTLRFLRLLFISLCITLAFFMNLDELGARMLYFYFLIEMALIIFFWLNSNKFASIFITFSYAFAINALHILSGKLF